MFIGRRRLFSVQFVEGPTCSDTDVRTLRPEIPKKKILVYHYTVQINIWNTAEC